MEPSEKLALQWGYTLISYTFFSYKEKFIRNIHIWRSPTNKYSLKMCGFYMCVSLLQQVLAQFLKYCIPFVNSNIDNFGYFPHLLQNKVFLEIGYTISIIILFNIKFLYRNKLKSWYLVQRKNYVRKKELKNTQIDQVGMPNNLTHYCEGVSG